MGGYLALQAAARHPDLVANVVLIESPIPTGWRSQVLTLAQLTGLAYRAGPAPVASRRRDTWTSREAARAFFASKQFVAAWAPGVLDDFIEHAIVDIAAGVTLKIPRNTERDIYAHVVHREALLSVRRLKRRGIPLDFICGERSEEIRLAGLAANERLFAPRFHRMPSGHLIPLEEPAACAGVVIQALQA
jgi:pimeloyl-ACP methyl ester carboxylesterase